MTEGAAALLREEVLVGRRAHFRHRIDLSARLITAANNVRIQLEDVSVGGACIRLSRPLPIDTARLCWLNFAVFGRRVWQEDVRCGLQFDVPLTDECLTQTIEFGELMATDPTDKFARLASAWVHGPGDW